MSIYSLTHPSEQALGLLLKAGGGEETLLLQRPENSLRAHIHVEPAGSKLQVAIHVAGSTTSTTLQAGDSSNAQHLADYIEAIANGNAETAAMVLFRVPVPERPRLTGTTAQRLLNLCTNGGTIQLLPGVQVSVHRTDAHKRTAIAAFEGFGTRLVSGSVRDVFASMVEHVEQQLAA